MRDGSEVQEPDQGARLGPPSARGREEEPGGHQDRSERDGAASDRAEGARMSENSVTIRRADTIWHEPGGWLDARWHFSFRSVFRRRPDGRRSPSRVQRRPARAWGGVAAPPAPKAGRPSSTPSSCERSTCSISRRSPGSLSPVVPAGPMEELSLDDVGQRFDLHDLGQRSVRPAMANWRYWTRVASAGSLGRIQNWMNRSGQSVPSSSTPAGVAGDRRSIGLGRESTAEPARTPEGCVRASSVGGLRWPQPPGQNAQ